MKKSLTTKLRESKREVTHYRDKAEQYRDAFFGQQEEMKKLKTALADISVGLVNDETKNNGWSHQTRLQYDAVRAITRIKPVSEPKGPFYI